MYEEFSPPVSPLMTLIAIALTGKKPFSRRKEYVLNGDILYELDLPTLYKIREDMEWRYKCYNLPGTELVREKWRWWWKETYDGLGPGADRLRVSITRLDKCIKEKEQ